MTDEAPDRVVVIGSGPSGAAAAHELARNRIPTIMLESGTVEPSGLLARARGRNLYRRVPDPRADPDRYIGTGDPSTIWAENLEPGGLSNQWTGAVPRFAPEDFVEGARLHERYRWPITYDDLVPYYERMEPLLHITASPQDVPALPRGLSAHERWLPSDWRSIARSAAQHGQGLTATPLADGPDWLVSRRGTAFNSYTGIVRTLLASRLFEVRTGAHALHLEWSGGKRRIESIVYHDRRTGRLERVRASAVVVACGPLRSTKLLFDSACPDFPEGIGNTEGLLGSYLHDHPKEWWSFETDRPLSRLAPSGYLTRRPYESSPPLMASSWTIGNATTRDKVLSLTPLRATSFGVQMFGTMVPEAKHYVRPSPTARDAFGLPQLEIHLEFDEATRSNMVDSRAHLLSVLASAGIGARAHSVVPQLAPGTAVHYGGTVRMHDDRAHGVLDAWNRPFDVPNLVVADASCFTTSSEKNPTLTAMALAARAADRLAHDLRTS